MRVKTGVSYPANKGEKENKQTLSLLRVLSIPQSTDRQDMSTAFEASEIERSQLEGDTTSSSSSLDVLNDAGIHRALEFVSALAFVVAVGECLRHGLGANGRGARQEDDLAVCGFRHGLHGLEIPDLHGWSARQDIGGLAHKLGGLDLCAGGNDFGLSDTLTLGGHRQGVLELIGEDDVLDQHALDLNTPTGCDVLDYLADGLCQLLATLDDVLEHTSTHDVTQRRLRALHQGLANIGDAEGCLVRGGDMVVDNGCEVQGNVVLGHADLFGDL